MRVGLHLPLADFGDGLPTSVALRRYAEVAGDLGFATLAANDHLFWRLPWLDGPTALASVLEAAGEMVLATTVTLPVVRHPVVVAKTLNTLAMLAPGRVVGGLGPGSSRVDCAAVGVPFEQRWARFDEAFALVCSLVRGEPTATGTFYGDPPGLSPAADPPPQVWFGSWGSDRRIAALAAGSDGWLASAYNATPDQFREARSRLDEHLRAAAPRPRRLPRRAGHHLGLRHRGPAGCGAAPHRRPGTRTGPRPGDAHAPADRQCPALRRGPRRLRGGRRP